MSKILIGTSGFSYDDWKGAFYPRGLKQSDFLEFYSRHYKALELNFSYYRIPEPSQSIKMLNSSERRLEFNIKAFREMTHEISENSIPEIVPLFLKGISPFVESGRLGSILLQFPQSFHYTPENRVYLKSLIDVLKPLPLSVEFRQQEWLKDSVYKTLRSSDVGFVCVDEPPLPSLIPPIVLTTSNLGYIRFHGRNSKKWYGTDSKIRYDYLYSEAELREWVPKIISLSKQTDKLFVFFNNHAKAQAITNANMLINLLAESQK